MTTIDLDGIDLSVRHAQCCTSLAEIIEHDLDRAFAVAADRAANPTWYAANDSARRLNAAAGRVLSLTSSAGQPNPTGKTKRRKMV